MLEILEKIKQIKEMFTDYIKNFYGTEEKVDGFYFVFCIEESKILEVLNKIIQNNLTNFFQIEKRKRNDIKEDNNCYYIIKIKLTN